MKKFFTLIAVAAMALSASAQTFRITWDEAVSFGYLESTYGSNGFVLTRTDDDDVRHTIQSKNAYFGDATTQEKFAFCFQTGGPSGASNGLSLAIPFDGTLKIYARSGSPGEIRNISPYFVDEYNQVFGKNFALNEIEDDVNHGYIEVEMEGNKSVMNPTGATKVYPVFSMPVNADTYYISYPDGRVDIYCIELIAGEGWSEPGSILFTEADVVAQSSGKPLNNKSFSNGGLSIKITDAPGSFAVYGSTAYFGDATTQTKYSYRLKTGGKSQTSTGKERFITMTVGLAGKVQVCARTAASDGRSRAININGKSVLLDETEENHSYIEVEMEGNKSAKNPTGATKVYPIYEFDVVAGPNTISFPDGAINIYNITYIPDTPTGISSVTTTATAAPAVKKYVENGKVVIVKDGKKFNIAGAQLK